ncbi:MAG: hypothetical protein WCE88_05560, partial [Burkholderiales bacterium]
MKFAVAALIASVSCWNGVIYSARAEAGVATDISALISRMSAAASQSCYMGTFVRESSGQM